VKLLCLRLETIVEIKRAGELTGICLQKILAGRREVGIMKVEAVGNYAVRLQFDDLHGAGLFTWEALYDLGSNKTRHMREYLQLLKENGLSRDPRRSRK